ncbi:Transcriptional regulatory protein DegU [Aquimixticola soesokkakensis]|uniref:Transcriptional regulatory protein DegU n=1 Tax=Aquimixticola soesokkakensis TaxID=1519096 RepID=A0A1Y5T0C0_9RHOB|nr:response regulator transcription factor [Aquimixticola soesokkakensis]SLN49164.1 Transcriptional regulatory protein DegU [Aquimixticola soesokkakensis]
MPDSTTPLSILLADDHQMVCDALKRVLSEDHGFQVDIAHDLEGTLRGLATGAYDVVLLDLSMPGMDGLAGLRRVVFAAPDSHVVLFSGNADDRTVWAAIDAGAKGYIPKSLSSQSLASTLQLVASGQQFVPLSVSRSAALRTENTPLSAQEIHILTSVANGKTNREIALDLELAEITIKVKMRAICTRLGAKNRTHAAMLAKLDNLL